MKPLERRRAALAAIGAAATALIAFALLRSPAPPPQAESPAMPAPPALSAPAEPPAPAPIAPPSAEGLKLHGLLATGAIVSPVGGRQRFVALGREVRPGLQVARIAQDHVVLLSDGGELRLGFDGEPAEQRPAAAAATPAAAAAATDGAEARLRDDAMAYRFGLEPRHSNGRITGYSIRPGANLPLLRRAGLRPGDVLVSVNGQAFDSDEKVLELPREIVGSFDAEFEFERDGRRMQASLQVNPRT